MEKEDEVNNIPNTNKALSMNSTEFQAVMGRRLLEIRISIRPKLSQIKLARETNLNQGIIQRLESSGRGTIENFLVILNYYIKRDINLNYILAENNTMFAPRLRPEDKIDNIENYFDPLT